MGQKTRGGEMIEEKLTIKSSKGKSRGESAWSLIKRAAIVSICAGGVLWGLGTGLSLASKNIVRSTQEYKDFHKEAVRYLEEDSLVPEDLKSLTSSSLAEDAIWQTYVLSHSEDESVAQAGEQDKLATNLKYGATAFGVAGMSVGVACGLSKIRKTKKQEPQDEQTGEKE